MIDTRGDVTQSTAYLPGMYFWLWSGPGTPRTQKAISQAAPVADMAVMFDNSFDGARAFSLARVQRHESVLFDCRDPRFCVYPAVRSSASLWLQKVVGRFET
jgi:hypothetical protein